MERVVSCFPNYYFAIISSQMSITRALGDKWWQGVIWQKYCCIITSVCIVLSKLEGDELLEVSLSRTSPLPRPWSTCCHKCIKRAIIWSPRWPLLCAIKASCCNVLRAILEQCSSNCPTRHSFIGQYSIGSQWNKSKKLITISYK